MYVCCTLLWSPLPWWRKGSCYSVHRVTLSLHVATISMRVRRFDCEGLWFVTDEDLCSQNVLLAFKLLLCVTSSLPCRTTSMHILMASSRSPLATLRLACPMAALRCWGSPPPPRPWRIPPPWGAGRGVGGCQTPGGSSGVCNGMVKRLVVMAISEHISSCAHVYIHAHICMHICTHACMYTCA